MIYATVFDLARVATGGWNELAERTVQDARVTGALLEASATSADRSEWGEVLWPLADAALASLADTLARTSRYADAFIVPRYGAILSTSLVAASDLPTAVATIALRRLRGTMVSQEIHDATKWADDYLRDIASGRLSLGTLDAQGQDPEARHCFTPRRITDASLEGF